mgnify:CR=1|jgi:hypothetical protein
MIVRLANVVYWSCNAAAVLWVAAITFATINHSRPDWGVWFGTILMVSLPLWLVGLAVRYVVTGK